MHIELIGYVAVDSGQLLLCDPCYIDSEWKKEDFKDIRIYKHKTTGDTLQYHKDFANYEQIIPKYNLTMNQLNASGEWEHFDAHYVNNSFSYNACTKAALSDDGHGQLNFTLGHAGVGVAFSTQIGDGYYPVQAVYDNDDNLVKVEVLFGYDVEEDYDHYK